MTTANEMYQQYLAAESAILSGQSVRMADRMLTRADLAEIRKGRQEWARLAAIETSQASGNQPRKPIQVVL